MRKQEKEKYLQLETKGYWSACGGVELKEIEYGTDDYIICVAGAWSSKKSVHRLKVYYSTRNKAEYVKLNGYRLYFTDCLRV